MNYSELSDFEINKLVAKCEGFNLFEGCVTKSKGDSWVRLTPYRNFDPCNNPSDAWPIIVDNQIALMPPVLNGTGGWKAERFYHENCGKIIDSISENPLRAAMIVYLMMKGLV